MVGPDLGAVGIHLMR